MLNSLGKVCLPKIKWLVKLFRKTFNKRSKVLLNKQFVLQVIDRNMDYGVVYEGRETSKTTDRNSDYGDYDYMSE